MERKTRFELATLALARRCSTTELLPQKQRPKTGGNRRILLEKPGYAYALCPYTSQRVCPSGYPTDSVRRGSRSPRRGGAPVKLLCVPIKNGHFLWARRDSNSDGLPHWNLNPARLPVPPRAQVRQRPPEIRGLDYGSSSMPAGSSGWKSLSSLGSFSTGARSSMLTLACV